MNRIDVPHRLPDVGDVAQIAPHNVEPPSAHEGDSDRVAKRLPGRMNQRTDVH